MSTTSSPGRPPILDEDKQKIACKLLGLGFSRRAAARFIGCSHNTILNTARRDPAFAQRLRAAPIEGEANHVEIIRRAGHQSWRASAWFLERRYPERWGRR